MSGLDENGTPLQERIEVENIYERYQTEKEALRLIENKIFGEGGAEQLRIYASMAEAGRAFMHDGIENHEVILVDEDLPLRGNRRESHRGVFNRLVHRIGGRRNDQNRRQCM